MKETRKIVKVMVFVTFFRFHFQTATAHNRHELTRIGAGAEYEAAHIPSQQQVGQQQEEEVELQLPAVNKHFPCVFPIHCSLQGHVQDNKQTVSVTEREQSI